jgi:hypothetical protein
MSLKRSLKDKIFQMSRENVFERSLKDKILQMNKENVLEQFNIMNGAQYPPITAGPMDSTKAAIQQILLRTMATIPMIRQFLPICFFSASWSFIQIIPRIIPITGKINNKM